MTPTKKPVGTRKTCITPPPKPQPGDTSSPTPPLPAVKESMEATDNMPIDFHTVQTRPRGEIEARLKALHATGLFDTAPPPPLPSRHIYLLLVYNIMCHTAIPSLSATISTLTHVLVSQNKKGVSTRVHTITDRMSHEINSSTSTQISASASVKYKGAASEDSPRETMVLSLATVPD